MPEAIINKFKDQYGKKDGPGVYYATAKAQGRDPETFKKESTMDGTEVNLEEAIDEAMAGINGSTEPAIVSTPAAPIAPPAEVAPPCPVGSEAGAGAIASVGAILGGGAIAPQEPSPMITLAPSPIVGSPSAGLPETVPGEVVPPASVGGIPPIGSEPPKEEGPIMEKKDKQKEEALKQIKGAGAGKDRKGNKHMPPAKKVEADKKKKAEAKPKYKPDWKKFDESVNLYIAKTSRNSDIGVNSLEKIWNECVEAQSKGEYSKSTRKFWIEVRTNFDKKVNEIFLQEAKKKMTERQKMNSAIEAFLEHVAKDKYVEAKIQIKEMAQACVNSMISERKVQYQKTLAEEIAKKVREAK